MRCRLFRRLRGSCWASRFSIFWGFVSAFAMTLAFALFTPAILSLAVTIWERGCGEDSGLWRRFSRLARFEHH